MTRITLRGVRGHLLRFVLTVASVTLGTALIAGTFVLTDSINKTFDSIFDSSTVGLDFVVRGQEAGESSDGSGMVMREQLPLALADSLREVPGVTWVSPDVYGTIVLVGKDGTAVRNGGAPNLGFGIVPGSPVATVTSGRLPEKSDEVVVETSTLERSGLKVGDRTQALIGRSPAEVTIVGEVEYGSPIAGATLVMLDMDTAIQVFTPDGKVSQISVAAEDGVTLEQFRDRLEALELSPEQLPATAEMLTIEQSNEEAKQDLHDALGFIRIFLLIFAGISIFVGAFIIFNTFSMLIAQRTRELALLRALGASRAQIILIVLGEAVLVGAFGGLVGLGAGIGLARLLQIGFGILGLEISGGLPVFPHTVFWTIFVGVGITVVSAVLPAIRASRIPPMAALREDMVRPVKGVRRLGAIGAGVFVAGALITTVAAQASSVNWWIFTVGAALLLVGALLVSPLLARPVVRVVTWPFVLIIGVVGRLARENGLRVPRRTAATASALTIGVTLIAGISVMAHSMKASVADFLDQQLTANLVLNGGQQMFPEEVITQAEQLPGVRSAVGVSVMALMIEGSPITALSSDPTGLAENVDIPMESGSLSVLDEGGIVLDAKVAADHGWKVGDTLTTVTGTASSTTITIEAIAEANSLLGWPMVAPRSLYEETVPPSLQGVYLGYIRLDPGADQAAVEQQLIDLVKPYLVISVQDAEEYKDDYASQVNTMLMVMYALLALSVVIAVLGIVNTLALSVFERTREIGLLRAVGLSRSQMSRTITLEAVATAILGGVIGTILGLGLGIALQRALESQGLETLSIPWGTLAILILASALAGVIAARFPASRAARLDVLKAISSE